MAQRITIQRNAQRRITICTLLLKVMKTKMKGAILLIIFTQRGHELLSKDLSIIYIMKHPITVFCYAGSASTNQKSMFESLKFSTTQKNCKFTVIASHDEVMYSSKGRDGLFTIHILGKILDSYHNDRGCIIWIST